MKQSEKNIITKNKILMAALEEFSINSYEKSSINKICENGKISKGVMYHYFKNKDELYLYCIRYCYDLTIEYYNSSLKECKTWKESIENYFKIRYMMFLEKPEIMKVIFLSILKEPEHLFDEIEKLKNELKEINYNFFLKILKKTPLRKELSINEIVEVIEMMENMLNKTFKTNENKEIGSSILEYEKNVKKLADILLYGIIEKN